MSCSADFLPLALSCARGPRQAALAEELISGPVRIDFEYPMGGMYGAHAVYGESKASHPSYRGLKARLCALGFVFKKEKKYFVAMTFPEG